MASSRCAASARAFPASPSLRATTPGFLDSSSNCLTISALLTLPFGPSSHVMAAASSPFVHPQQRGVAVDIDLMGCAVDLYRESHGCLSVAGADRTQPADLDSSRPAAWINGRVSLRMNADDRLPLDPLG